METIHIIMKITTITEMIPTAAPALNIPAMAEQLLNDITAKANNSMSNFFIG
jgi:hypothetical protein